MISNLTKLMTKKVSIEICWCINFVCVFRKDWPKTNFSHEESAQQSNPIAINFPSQYGMVLHTAQ